MERQRPKTERDYEREIYNEVDGPSDRADEHDTEIERRRGPEAFHHVDPEEPRDRNESVYGETEVDPSRFDRKSDHHAQDTEEHL